MFVSYVYHEGDSYYKYDDEADAVVDGFPRKISTDFGSKPGGNDSVPDNVDAALFDNLDSMLYFFKADLVSLISITHAPDTGVMKAEDPSVFEVISRRIEWSSWTEFILRVLYFVFKKYKSTVL